MWKKGVVVKVFKKCDLHKCNSRKVAVRWTKGGIDKKVREEQAGFPPKKSTTEEIFILGNILEQANEWRRAGLYAQFVDFEKAFDSRHRESLLNIMRSYGTPNKMAFDTLSHQGLRKVLGKYQCPSKFINPVKTLHNEMQAHGAQGNHISKEFAVINGVKQDSVLAATLFSL